MKRLLVHFGDFDGKSTEREPKGVTHGESFGDRRMLRRGKTVLKEVGDPAGPIDEQRRDDRFASRFLQLTDNIVQALRRQLALSFAPLGDSGRSFGRNCSMRAPLHLGGDVIGLEGEAVSLSGRCEKRRQHETRLATIDGDADDHTAPFEGAESEPDRG
jgi:hypothetical protein